MKQSNPEGRWLHSHIISAAPGFEMRSKGPGLSDPLEVRSSIQQVRHEAPAIDRMFDKDDTDPRREIFPSVLFGLWYRNP
jgi:hypothetical protein